MRTPPPPDPRYRLPRDESVDGDQLSSDAHEPESSEASASESDGSAFSIRAKRQPARLKIPFIDPVTGQKRKRGRPRKDKDQPGSAIAKRRGRPSKDPATGEKRKQGRPRKIKGDVEGDAGGVAAKRKRGRPRKVDCHDGASAGNAVGNGTATKRKLGRPKKVVAASENGSEVSGKKRKLGRPRKDGSVTKASHVSHEKGEASGKRRGPGRPPKQVGEGQDADGAASGMAIAAAPAFSTGSLAGPSPPAAGIKRGRGRPRKNAPTSPAAVVDNKGDGPSTPGGEV